MSYNIDTIKIVAADSFRISRDSFDRLRLKLSKADRIPEGNVFDQLLPDDGRIVDCEHIGKYGDAGWSFAAGASFWWYGEWSGHCLDALQELLAEFSGSADLVVCWEGGDSFQGLRVKDGKVTEHVVVQALGPEKRT